MRQKKLTSKQIFDMIIEEEKNKEKKSKLLIHSCCAPCTSYPMELLDDIFDITIYFYNPNITTRSEFERRIADEERMIKEMGLKAKLIKGEFLPRTFVNAVKGYERDFEGGERCFICYEMRMLEAVKLAKEFEADYFGTVLTISPMKSSELINKMGERLGLEYGIKYLPSDFKKDNGFLRSTQLCKEYKLYRQDFCGCPFSKRETMQFRKEKAARELLQSKIEDLEAKEILTFEEESMLKEMIKQLDEMTNKAKENYLYIKQEKSRVTNERIKKEQEKIDDLNKKN